MEFNRRDFIKGTLALGSIAAVGGLAGCSSPQNQSPDSSPLADTGSIPGIPESFTDGKWIGTAMGHDDDLIVEVAAQAATSPQFASCAAMTPSASAQPQRL